MTLLKVKDFSLSINDEIILHNINMEIKAGKVLAIVGESGSGKSMMSSAIINLLPQGAKLKGKILLNNDNLLDKSEREMCLHRMNDLGMIFQEP
ncbi:MAG: ATP-binding cassette domain-containing protein, partial [Kordiimonadaceae bacterium]|nr:ATP-binding cassette domain-containing protein [Kordiimonadaceae bacterium]